MVEVIDPRTRVESLLSERGLLAADGHGLVAQRQKPLRNKLGSFDVRYPYIVRDSALWSLYGEGYRRSPGLFQIIPVENKDRLIFSEFTSSCFPKMRSGWQLLLQEHTSGSGTYSTPHDEADLERLLDLMIVALNDELSELGLEGTDSNRQRLLSIRMAMGSGYLLPGRPVRIDEVLDEEMVRWWNEGIDLRVTLFAFGPRSTSGSAGKLLPALIPLEDAKEAADISFARLRTLYADSEEPYSR